MGRPAAAPGPTTYGSGGGVGRDGVGTGVGSVGVAVGRDGSVVGRLGNGRLGVAGGVGPDGLGEGLPDPLGLGLPDGRVPGPDGPAAAWSRLASVVTSGDSGASRCGLSAR